jgi:hypothetical protein
MRVLVLLLAFFVAGCASTPPADTPPWVGKYKNACLPEAIVMTQGLKKHGIQAKVLTIYTDKWGHAVCVYLYPTGQNRMWVWDSYWKSVNIRAYFNDPNDIAKAWMRWTMTDAKLNHAVFVE